MKIYLFRHGETDWNVPHRMQGSTDIPLNERGLKQAGIVAEKIRDIRFDAAFASPLIRAVVTAQILLDRDSLDEDNPLTLQLDKRLEEIGFGVHEGEFFEDVVGDAAHPLNQFITAPDQYIPPEGAESIDVVWQRMKAFFDEMVVPLEKELPDDANVLVVAHGGSIRALTCNLAGRPYTQFWGDKHMTNLALNLLEVKDGQLTLLEEAKEML